MPGSSETDGAAAYDGEVFEHGLAAITEARRLHGRDLQRAVQLVDDQSRECLALDVLRDDEQRLTVCTTASSSGSMSLRPESFFSWMRM